MSKSTTFILDQIQENYFVAWNVTSQCMNTASIEIKSGKQVIKTIKKTDSKTDFHVLDQGTATIEAKGGLTVTVTVNEAKIELKNCKTGAAIMDNAGKTVGYMYDICIEDSVDDDYNDIFINIVGWARKG